MIQDKAIEIESLEFSYRKGSPLFFFNNLDIFCGERIFVHGPSGSGKSTFLGLVCGILSANKGQIKVFGKNLNSMSQFERDQFRGKDIGYIFQMFNLIPYLNVIDNICLPIYINRSRSKEIMDENKYYFDYALELAKKLGIEKVLYQKPSELSVGQAQRVAVARALVCKPRLIIADEPTSALDADHREKFIDLLNTESQKMKMTVLFVSHDHDLKQYFQRSISILEIQKKSYEVNN